MASTPLVPYRLAMEMIQPIRTMTWAALFRFLKEKGVRPGYPTGGQEAWTFPEIAERAKVSERLVKMWAKGEQKCADIKMVASLFANRGSPLFQDICFVHDSHFGFQDQYDYLTRISTVHGFWELALEKANISELRKDRIDARSVDHAAHLINFFDGTIPVEEARSIANSARQQIYDLKYGARTPEDDSRHRLGIEGFNRELTEVFEEAGIGLLGKKTVEQGLICVGVGCGLEGVGVYDRFTRFVGVDISLSALELAAKSFPKSEAMLPRAAEQRWDVNEKFDVYVSLKTFQSSFFDIPKAIEQCARLLKLNGKAIISIPRGYYRWHDENGEWLLTEGLSRSLYNLFAASAYGTYVLPEKDYTIELIGLIANELYRCQFADLRLRTGLHEHYIIARRG